MKWTLLNLLSALINLCAYIWLGHGWWNLAALCANCAGAAWYAAEWAEESSYRRMRDELDRIWLEEQSCSRPIRDCPPPC